MTTQALVVGWTLLSIALGNQAVAGDTARRPNVLFILTDDLGYGDLGCHGCKDIPTPHLDALAKQGVRCTNGYAAAPVGGPTRAALMTGRYPQRFGHEFNPPRDPKAAYGLPLAETTLAEVLRTAGYRTGWIGKWHLGRDGKAHPLQRGLDEFFGFLDGAHYYLKPDLALPGLPSAPVWANGILRGTKPVEEKEYLTDAFTREALAFLDRRREQPFFLVLSYNAPHTPLEAPEKYLKRVYGVTGGDHRRRLYAAMIVALDDGVGAVTARLRETGRLRDTLIVFLSDNGGITGYLSPSRNTPLTGAKSELLEGGIRVPFLVQWPSRLPAAAVYHEPVSVLDLFPTAVAAAGAKLPGKLTLDGIDLLPHLSRKSPSAPERLLYWRYGPNGALRAGRHKLLQLGKEPPQLYDLQADLGETRDLTKENPELVRRLTEEWKRWDAQLQPPAWNKPNAPPWW